KAEARYKGWGPSATKDIRTVIIEFVDEENNKSTLTFSAPSKSYGFSTGILQKTTPYQGESDDAGPTMRILTSGTECSGTVGDYIVHEAVFDTSGPNPKVISFGASFSQKCFPQGMQQGAIYFNAIPKDPKEPKEGSTKKK